MYACVFQSCLTLCDSMYCSPPDSPVHGILQAGILEWVAISFSRPRAQTYAFCIGRWVLYHRVILHLCTVAHQPPLVHGDSPGKNTGVDCHAFFQGIFLAQEPNWGLLHCRQILYQLSYQRSPLCIRHIKKK